jgi:uncharacterized protein YprB with RNaseH-like and TPR domain
VSSKRSSPKVLFLDIETKPLLAYVWSIWQQNVGLNQIQSDWSILSFAAKWLGDPPSKVIYRDLSRAKDVENDRPLLDALWKLLDEADVVVTQNGIQFDKKKIFARLAIHNMPPPSGFKMIDTKVIAKRVFGFTSNRLEYLSSQLNTKFKKQRHEEFAGFELWKECLAKNKAAWKAMREYNIYDVLALEELYHKLIPWDGGVNYNLFTDDETTACHLCGGETVKRGFMYTTVGKYQRYRCTQCGAWTRGRENLFSPEKKKSLRTLIR